MEIPSLKKLRELRDQIREELKQIKVTDYTSSNYGSESEYTIRGIIAGANALMFDISAICKNSASLVKMTTATERSSIISSLTNLLNHLEGRSFNDTATDIDKLKVQLRPFAIRNSSEREEEFISYIDDLQKKITVLNEEIKKLEEIKISASDSESEIKKTTLELQESVTVFEALKVELKAKIDETEKIRLSIDELLAEDEAKTEEIRTHLTEAKSHKELIDSFSKRVSSREDQLDKQQTLTDEYIKTLNEFKEGHESILVEASGLIESAKLALQYKTAEGLSAAFAEKHSEAASDKSTDAWITRATLFLCAAVLVGVWLFLDKTVNIETIVGRLSLIPILIAGAWFSAGQYIKQKNIAEDYAYKSVLAKSIVGFSDQLSDERKKGEDYSHYVKSVLSEIHKDPLRTRVQTSKSQFQGSEIKDLLKELSAIRSLPDRLEKILSRGDKA